MRDAASQTAREPFKLADLALMSRARNYFAWQAFGRGYDIENREAVPAYLRRDVYDVIRTRTDQVEVHHASLTDFLEKQPAQSMHRYVLLDAQDALLGAMPGRR